MQLSPSAMWIGTIRTIRKGTATGKTFFPGYGFSLFLMYNLIVTHNQYYATHIIYIITYTLPSTLS